MKISWLVSLVALASAAYLVSLGINALLGNEIRNAIVHDITTVDSSRPGAKRAEDKDYQLIVERNLFHSAKAATVPLSQQMVEFALQMEPHLERETIIKVFSEGKDFMIKQGELDQLELYCHIVEGRYCHFTQTESVKGHKATGDHQTHADKRSLTKNLSVEVTDQIGEKYLEHAKGNGVRIRLSKGKGKGKIRDCQVDWGWGQGLEELKVR